jgi:glycosyltransferase involved in cell wall biosynthesis
MRFSIVLPTHNRLDTLKLVLAGIQEQDYPAQQFELVVVSDGSTDGTDEYLSNLQTPFRLKAVSQQNQGVASARNTGIDCADGEIIVFLDDDTFPLADFLIEHERMHKQHGPDTVVLGPMLAPPDFRMAPWVSWEQARLQEQYHDMAQGHWAPTPRQFFTANASIARPHLLRAGGFDAAFRRAEDVELAYRLDQHGMRFVFHPKAVVYHYAERSFEAWMAIPYAYGSNDVIFAHDRGQDWLLPTVFKEYHTRHTLVKTLISVCLSRKITTQLFQAGLKRLLFLSDKLGLVGLSHLICGGIFNLRYYQGVSDGLGGRQAFYAAIKDAAAS